MLHFRAKKRAHTGRTNTLKSTCIAPFLSSITNKSGRNHLRAGTAIQGGIISYFGKQKCGQTLSSTNDNIKQKTNTYGLDFLWCKFTTTSRHAHTLT